MLSITGIQNNRARRMQTAARQCGAYLDLASCVSFPLHSSSNSVAVIQLYTVNQVFYGIAQVTFSRANNNRQIIKTNYTEGPGSKAVPVQTSESAHTRNGIQTSLRSPTVTLQSKPQV